MSAPFILCIAVPSPLRRVFDYLPVRGMNTPPTPGVRIRVSFGGRQMIGILVAVSNTSTITTNKLKPAIEVLDDEPLIPPHLLSLCQWAAQYYQHPIGDALHALLPVLVRQGDPLHAEDTLYGLSHKADMAPPTRAIKQMDIINILKLHPHGLSESEFKVMALSKSALTALINKGFVIKQKTRMMPNVTSSTEHLLREVSLTLNIDQQHALDKITTSLNQFETFLLDGITGSGKTEVYLQIIEKVINEGKQALILVPEIGLTPQTVLRFRQRFNVVIAVLHSGLTDHERLNAWVSAREGEARIIIGTRSAVFTPMLNPGIIIIDEEHDISFKQQDGFRYHARDLSVLRARTENIPVVLGSATPSFESIHNAQQTRYQWLHLNARAGEAGIPTVHLLDIRSRPLQSGLSQPLIDAIKFQIKEKKQVLIFLNRRGFAPTLMCHECGWIAQCKRCDARMTIHRQPAHLHCHHCGSQRPIDKSCPQCKKAELLMLGLGTEQTEETLKTLFPHTRIIRIDRDSTRRKYAMEDYLAEIKKGEPCILLGTQILAKGHHFPHVTLVGIIDIDSGLFSADFRGLENCAQLLTQVSGRAGRADHAGEVIVQTHHADHPMMQCLIQKGYAAFAQQALAERKLADLPPYSHLALFRAEALLLDTAESFLTLVKKLAAEKNYDAVSVLGPIPASMTKRAGWLRAHLLLQASSRGALQQLLSVVCTTIESLPEARRVRWSIDVDPQDMF
jgi:primosomal protein N' (replication factor Y)